MYTNTDVTLFQFDAETETYKKTYVPKAFLDTVFGESSNSQGKNSSTGTNLYFEFNTADFEFGENDFFVEGDRTAILETDFNEIKSKYRNAFKITKWSALAFGTQNMWHYEIEGA